MGPEYYRNCVGNICLAAGMKALDLGCGPGSLSFALAENAHPESMIHGLDISKDQLEYARKHAGLFDCTLEFLLASMDELQYPDRHFDLVMTSMALHETPPKVRRAAIAETTRVLKDGGRFVLVDWSRPKFGLWGCLWYPLIRFGNRNQDNWHNVYHELCLAQGLTLVEDHYLNSLARRQVFRKGIREE